MADKKKQVEGIIARQRKLAEEQLGLAADLEALLNGDNTTGQDVARLFKTWGDLWAKRYARDHVFTSRAKVGAAFKKLLATMPVTDIEARMRQYLASRDPFYSGAGYAIEVFLKAINKFPGIGPDPGDGEFLQAPVGDCKHSPRCKSDQAHTRLRAQEMRA